MIGLLILIIIAFSAGLPILGIILLIPFIGNVVEGIREINEKEKFEEDMKKKVEEEKKNNKIKKVKKNQNEKKEPNFATLLGDGWDWRG